ncbi:MAG: branched-chain amino acid transaminase [Ignavibacteria bacterium]|jgi:branched-chain amino acid aminotransferase|nr:branched-chain amino acid transaminase [Ignavibacteria bacterium]MCU7511629.1 branched-chain amino acid transaminase [Ignavibacteria bacterium]MCU7519157.1 branched-chain amino acid transaminase [Ignavibacteria bacterium]MCU7523787.1 branched-chain amino acid transaminase [Ignavibacteria bacterium]
MAFESDYVWMEGQMVPFNEAKLHFLTSSLHYGTGVFEGIRSYSTPNGPAVFRLKDHLNRLIKSTQVLGMSDLQYSIDEIYNATIELVRINKMEECYIRPLVYIKEGGWNLTVDGVKIDLSIAVWKWTNYLGQEALKRGVRANVSSYPRHHPNIMMTKAKVAGNYVNSVLAKTESLRAGFDEAILLDPYGYVSECTGENIFLVRNGIIYTPPRTGVLEGVTRDSIIAVAKDRGYEVIEEQISRDQLYIADEVFVTGTASEVIALREIDNRKIGAGSMGPVSADLQEAYTKVIHGKDKNYEKWLDYIYTDDSDEAREAV